LNGFLAIATPDGECTLAVTPEDRAGDRMCANPANTVRVALDGRLDNRDELIAAFAGDGRPVSGDGDAEIVLRAYDTWGDACAAHLRGDFAFALWDARRGALVCGRDILGSRPLYVHARGGTIAAASEIAPLLRTPGVSREPNEALLAECLNGNIVDRTATVWRDIDRLPPAHVLVAERGRVETRGYWQPDPRREIRYRTDDEYGEHLADLLRAAIRRRMSRHAPVGVMLSGGLDSSSIVAALHDLALAGADRPLPTYSLTTRGEPWDEVEYLDAVTARYPVISERRRHFEAPAEYYAAKTIAYQDLPPFPNGVMADSILSAAADAGHRVLLTGLWSDEWLGGSFLHYADLIEQRRFRDAWRLFRAQSDRADAFRPTSLFRSSIWPLVPPSAREAIKGVLGRDGVAPWVTRAFASRVDLPSRLRPAPPPIQLATRAKTESWSSAMGGLSIRATEEERRTTAAFGIETRHPFGDRSILEFGLALPENQRWRGQLAKPVLRHAGRAWLPPLVLERSTVTGAASVIGRAVERQFAAGLWDNASTVRRGWVNRPALLESFDEMQGGRTRRDGAQALAFPLWLACSVELFARHVLEESRG
jgi:asparagine synthase (glutamine-hydrolysing)